MVSRVTSPLASASKKSSSDRSMGVCTSWTSPTSTPTVTARRRSHVQRPDGGTSATVVVTVEGSPGDSGATLLTTSTLPEPTGPPGVPLRPHPDGARAGRAARPAGMGWGAGEPGGTVRVMASTKSPAVEIEVAGRTVRITSSDRVIFPEPGITKRELVDYYLAVGDGILRALYERPVTLERWPKGVREGMKRATRAD